MGSQRCPKSIPKSIQNRFKIGPKTAPEAMSDRGGIFVAFSSHLGPLCASFGDPFVDHLRFKINQKPMPKMTPKKALDFCASGLLLEPPPGSDFEPHSGPTMVFEDQLFPFPGRFFTILAPFGAPFWPLLAHFCAPKTLRKTHRKKERKKSEKDTQKKPVLATEREARSF